MQNNITAIDISSDSSRLLVVDEEGRCSLINLVKKVTVASFNLHGKVECIKFSPNNKLFAVAVGKVIQVWQTPFTNVKEFAPFDLKYSFGGYHTDSVKSLKWSNDGSYLLSSSKDLTCRIFKMDAEKGYVPTALAGHKSQVVNAFFSINGDAVYSVTRDGTLFHWIKNEAMGWELKAKHFFHQISVKVKSCAFQNNLLVVGFNNGVFGLWELPDFNQIHSLSISQNVINTVSINNSGEWLAFGSSKMGQLIVWEWQSESFILKQQGHYFDTNVLAYSADGQILATGGDDGKVKLWNTQSGFCFVTFSEHEGPITGVQFAKNGKIVVSASNDGTVRAFDLVRYRNFKTMTTPKPVQFSCLAVDVMGEIVLAGSFDTFEIFCWSIQTGKLLQVFSGHTGPISSLDFHPNGQHFISGSWDKTGRAWDIYSQAKEMTVFNHVSDILAVAYRPDGGQVCISCLDGTLNFWNTEKAIQTATIEGRRDIAGGRGAADFVTAANNASGKSFNSICYSADGNCILAGGNSKYICIYELQSLVMLKKFILSKNMAFDGIQEFLNSKRNTEAGPIDLIDIDEDEDMDRQKDDSLPGTKRGDLSDRKVRLAVRTKCTKFSPTGKAWAAATTEGLLIYSIDDFASFDPFDLDLEITPASILETVAKKEFLKALIMSFRLNESTLTDQVFSFIPHSHIDLIVRQIPECHQHSFMAMIARKLEGNQVQLMTEWVYKYLTFNTISASNKPLMRDWQKHLSTLYNDLNQVVTENCAMLNYLSNCPQ